MRVLISFSILSLIKIITRIFYRVEITWLHEQKPNWDKIRLVVFLNHTSLYEPLYLSVVPFPFLWRIARKLVAPGADKTLNRPLVGLFWKLMFGTGVKTITRKRDGSWVDFMSAIKDRSVILILPEGRMKRANGLDTSGKKMTVRGGIGDIMEQIDEGNMMVAYSGGLHHIQIPGQFFPKLFKTIKVNIEVLDIEDYKKKFVSENVQFKKDIVADMQWRLENYCPEEQYEYPSEPSVS